MTSDATRQPDGTPDAGSQEPAAEARTGHEQQAPPAPVDQPEEVETEQVEAEVEEAAEQLSELEVALHEASERLADLQRLQAEFLNYKRRVERDRELVRENAVFTVLLPMLDVLDSIDRARAAGEVEGGFKGVADQLERVVAGLGLSRFGEPGDAFDPTLHEALSHVGADPSVEVVTCKHIAKTGYKIGDRVVRAAQVLVVDPEPSQA